MWHIDWACQSMKAFRWRFCHCESLQDDLWKLTDRGHVEVPPQLLNRVVQASSNADDRQIIMQHLQANLSISNDWRHLAGGLTLLGELLKQGPSILFEEIANGYHFDPVQRLSFLETFQYTEDKRVEQLIRTKAVKLREALLQKMCSSGELPSDVKCISSSDRCAVPTWRQGPVHGMVVIGHHEDTDEESGDETRKPPASTVSTQSGGDLLEGDWCCVSTGQNEQKASIDLLDFSG